MNKRPDFHPPTPLMQRLVQLLRTPIVKTVQIPKDARVDPASFPESEFPVQCMMCGYTLNGLGAEGRCPECGEAFERGRLLVEIYVNGRRPWKHRIHRMLSWVSRLLVLIALLNIAGYALMIFALRSSNANIDTIATILRVYLTIMLFALIASLFSFALLITLSVKNRVSREKRRHVLAALADSEQSEGADGDRSRR